MFWLVVSIRRAKMTFEVVELDIIMEINIFYFSIFSIEVGLYVESFVRFILATVPIVLSFGLL